MRRRFGSRRNAFGQASPFWGEPLESRILFSQINIPFTNANDSGPGSLRNAIISANALPTSDDAVIKSNIPGTGVHVINLLSGLPFVTGEVNIIGQTDSKGNPLTELNGQSAGAFSDGLFLEPSVTGLPDSTISGLIINRFGSSGIDVNGGGATIYGCRIGTNAAGTAALPNGQEGILLEGQGSVIGEAAAGPAFQVLISGNKTNGITITSSNNRIQNCLIGTDVTGTLAIPNAADGINDVGSNNHIGEPVANGGLVISGNGAQGVDFNGSKSFIENCKIGTDITGTKALGNKGVGVQLDGASYETVGQSGTSQGNVISANRAGVDSTDSTGTLISSNKVGTNAAGTAALGNLKAGVFIASDGNTAEFNLVSGNGFDGIVLEEGALNTVNNWIISNHVGTDVTGKKPIPNKGDGILVDSSFNNTISKNIIAFSAISGEDGFGVDVLGTTSTGNRITENSIFSNGRLGINLGDNAGKVLPNDNKDGDTGPNNLQNYPVLTSATPVSGKMVIKGTLNSNPNHTFRLEFFASAAKDPSGYGEGQTYAGTVNVTTNASGNASFTISVSPVAGETYWTATAISSTGDTSEFSKAIT